MKLRLIEEVVREGRLPGGGLDWDLICSGLDRLTEGAVARYAGLLDVRIVEDPRFGATAHRWPRRCQAVTTTHPSLAPHLTALPTDVRESLLFWLAARGRKLNECSDVYPMTPARLRGLLAAGAPLPFASLSFPTDTRSAPGVWKRAFPEVRALGADILALDQVPWAEFPNLEHVSMYGDHAPELATLAPMTSIRHVQYGGLEPLVDRQHERAGVSHTRGGYTLRRPRRKPASRRVAAARSTESAPRRSTGTAPLSGPAYAPA
jgi:hypothetical protein